MDGECQSEAVEDHKSSAGPWVRFDALLLLWDLPKQHLQTLGVGEFPLWGDSLCSLDRVLFCFVANWILQKLTLKQWISVGDLGIQLQI